MNISRDTPLGTLLSVNVWGSGGQSARRLGVYAKKIVSAGPPGITQATIDIYFPCWQRSFAYLCDDADWCRFSFIEVIL